MNTPFCTPSIKRHEKRNNSRTCFEEIAMDVVVMAILPFFEIVIIESTKISDLYGYFKRDPERKKYFLFHSVNYVRLIRYPRFRPAFFPKLWNFQRVRHLCVDTPNEHAVDFIRKVSSISKNLLSLSFKVRRRCTSLSNLFSEKKCFPNLQKLEVHAPCVPFFSTKWCEKPRIWRSLKSFVLDANDMNESQQPQNPIPFLQNENELPNMTRLVLCCVKLPAIGSGLNIPNLRCLKLTRCHNVEVHAGRFLKNVDITRVTPQSISKRIYSRLRPQVLEKFGFYGPQGYHDHTWMFVGENCTPLKEFSKIRAIYIFGLKWEESKTGTDLFPGRNLEDLRVYNCPSFVGRSILGLGKLRILVLSGCSGVTGCIFSPIDGMKFHEFSGIEVVRVRRCSRLRDDFFRFFRFPNLVTLEIHGCNDLQGKGWNGEFSKSVRRMRFEGVEEDFVNPIFEDHDFPLLTDIFVTQNLTKRVNWKEKMWMRTPSLKKVEIFPEKLRFNLFRTLRQKSSRN